MQPSEVYESGSAALAVAWASALAGDTGDLPPEIRADISAIMDASTQISHRYSMLTQPLLKLVLGGSDSRVLEEFPSVDGSFSARTFAKATIVKLEDLNSRLGASDDPYVSNPLRERRLGDGLLSGRGGKVWAKLFRVLEYVDEKDAAQAVLACALSEVTSRSPKARKQAAAKKLSEAPVDVSAVADAQGIDEHTLLDILDVLQGDQPQVILAGPPGTSKTEIALALASVLTGGSTSDVKVLQFHASYGYEDFVEGLRPAPAVGGGLTFEVVPGAIRRIAADAADGNPHVLVMDEMNRANLPRVLGELLFAFERRAEPVDLLYTEAFELPRNVAFIGTMNTADRSIRSIDAAVRRRFQIFEFPPRPDVVEAHYRTRPNSVPDLVAGMKSLNALLEEEVDRHHTIGHTYYLRDEMDAVVLERIWVRQIYPLVEEIFFDQGDLLSEITIGRFWPSLVGSI